jgi:pimeloyl-ACP methyl ester carboxylesterase
MNVFRYSIAVALVSCIGLTASDNCQGQAAPNQTFDKNEAARAWWELYFKDSRSVALPDGRTLNLLCEGHGSPVVILDAGMGNGAWTWRHVHAELARTTRVCAYDRSGYGQSSRSAGARNAGVEADELAELLKRAELPAPYVIVGRSYAGYIDRLYVSRHTEEVAALILIDPSSEYQFTRFASVSPTQASSFEYGLNVARACLKAAQAGAVDHRCDQQTPLGLPAARYDWWAKQVLSLAEAASAEFIEMNTTSSEQLVAERHSLGALPLFILSSGNPATGRDQVEALRRLWRQMHEETLRISSNSKLEVVDGAGHQIQEDRPMAVVEAINSVVGQVRVGPNSAGVQEK